MTDIPDGNRSFFNTGPIRAGEKAIVSKEDCNCGVPNKANWHVHVVYGRTLFPEGKTWRDYPDQTTEDLERRFGTETDYTDAYACDAHKGTTKDYRPKGWVILESKFTRLR